MNFTGEKPGFLKKPGFFGFTKLEAPCLAINRQSQS
jgi:hypothetical protein